MIPEEKKTAVLHALQATFGISEYEDIHALTAGLSSALIYRIVVLGKAYLLRVITSTDAMADPANWYNSMQVGAAAGLAPQVRYANLDERILITDFIEAVPFPLSEAKIMMPVLLRRLHALPTFAKRINYFDAVDGLVAKFKAAKILPESMTEELFRQYERITGVYPRSGKEFVSCHNDLKPENILFDGNRAWLVDWEAAFLNDRYSDLAIAANFVVRSEDDETDFLTAYFDYEVSEYNRARFFLMRQVMHVSYFTLFMLIVSRTGTAIDADSAKPGFREFNDRMWAGEIDLADTHAKLQYAWVHLEQLRYNLNQQRFEDSLRVIAGG